MWFVLVATVIVGGLLYTYFSTPNKDFWKKHGIKEIDTSAAGSFLDFVLQKKGFFEKDHLAYQALGNEKFCVIRELGTPLLLIKDLDLIKKILIKDFDYFADRREFFQGQDPILEKMLVSLTGDEWKGVRYSITPTFTTGKIRKMMSFFNSVGLEWVEDLKSKSKQDQTGSISIDVLETANHYTVDVLASAVFGLNAGTIKNPKSKFATYATRMFDMNWKQMIRFAVAFSSPKVSGFLKLKLFDEDVLQFFNGILDQGLKARLRGEVKRDDFLQLLVKAKKGELKAAGADELSDFEKDAQISRPVKKQYLTEDVMNAQSFNFVMAGFVTTSSLITFVAYVLAAYQDVQEKVRKEVSKIVKDDSSFDYDKVGQLVYLDMVISETLRIFPGMNRLERVCVKDYRDPETGLFVPKGTLTIFPTYSMHNDKKYFDNPDKFDPDHFSPEKKAARNPYVYMPFGIGPRNCIGMKFALSKAKTAIAHLVHSFIIEPTPKTPLPIRGKIIGPSFAPPTKLELKLTPLRN